MAEIVSTGAAFYRGGVYHSDNRNMAGWEGAGSTPNIARYTFKTDASGALSLSFKTDNNHLAYGSGGPYLNFSISSGESDYVGATWSTPGLGVYRNGGGTASVQLLPNTQYYLWLHPSYGGYSLWSVGSGVKITTSGQYGTASSFTVSNGELGSPLSITLTRALSSAKHTVSASLLGRTETLLTKGDTYPSLSWTPSLADYAPLMSATSATATITVETFYNNNSVGTTQRTVTLTLPASVSPKLGSGWVSLKPYNAGAASAISGYVAGYSSVEALFDASKVDMSADYGASLSFKLTALGAADTASPYRTPIISGKTAITCAAVDSRGRSQSESFSITPMDYQPPRISAISYHRSDTEGSPSEDGSCLAVKADAVYSPLGGENSCSINAYIRPLSGSFGAAIPLSSGTQRSITALSPDLSYELKITISDRLGNENSYLRQIPTRAWAMKFRPDSRGLAFGKAPEHERALELPSDWSLRRGVEECAQFALGPRSLTLSAAWSGTAAPYTQTLSLPGALAGDFPLLRLSPSGSAAAIAQQLADFSKIYGIVPAADALTLYASEKPSAALTLQVLILRS